MPKTKLILTLLLAVGFFLPMKTDCYAADFHVSPSGDGSSCTSGSPCSLASANSNARAGDRVILAGGSYSTSINPARSGSSGAPIVYTVSSGATVNVTAQRGVDLRNGQDHITVQRGNGAALIFSGNSFRVIDAVTADHLVIDGIKTINIRESSDRRGIQFDQCNYITFKNGDIAVDRVELDYHDYTFFENCTHLDIGPDNTFGNASHAIVAIKNAQFVRVHNNVFDNKWRHGFNAGGVTGGSRPADFLIENNLFNEVGKLTNENPAINGDEGRSTASFYLSTVDRAIARNNFIYKGDIAVHLRQHPDSGQIDYRERDCACPLPVLIMIGLECIC